MKKLRVSQGILVVGALLLAAGAAEAKLEKTGQAAVSFTAVGPAGLKIVGTTSALTVQDEAATLTVKVALADLTTGIDLRDRHMREKYLEVPKFPAAVLVVDRGGLKMPEGAETSGDLPGKMSIHGKEKELKFHYVAKKTGPKTIHVEGTVQLNIKDFGITVPSYLGITVKPDVQVSVSFDLEDR